MTVDLALKVLIGLFPTVYIILTKMENCQQLFLGLLLFAHTADHSEARFVDVRVVIHVLNADIQPTAQFFDSIVSNLFLLFRSHLLASLGLHLQ